MVEASVRGPVSRRARKSRKKDDIKAARLLDRQPWHRYYSGREELLQIAAPVARNVKVMLMTEPAAPFPQQKTNVDRNSDLENTTNQEATARFCGPVPGAPFGTLGSVNLTCLYYVNPRNMNFNDMDAFW